MLNRVGLVGHSRGSFSRLKLVGHPRGPFSWVKLVGQTRGSFSYVKLVGHSRGSISWVKLVSHSRGSNSWVKFLVIYCHWSFLCLELLGTLRSQNCPIILVRLWILITFSDLQFVICISLFPTFQYFSFFFWDSGILPTLKTKY